MLVWTAACASDAQGTQCATTDDGTYDCDFRAINSSGSFEISAPGKPTYVLDVVEPGVAFGFVDLGSGAVPLPGRYLRSADEPACWLNEATETRICARQR
ncbi:hypothetical protein [Roseitranquillus sediminis]|uniref:hypothetical protein n=1 Tax=Roseitranquillus sediminis TaxID=2809051 RepID=UPI001D0C5494|nr:hypothetical protein [Roseitranquillus sediminis]MBM9593294.1 hypothetical protein [Roseitranquillus sediminis]